jgi:hypothetical protein
MSKRELFLRSTARRSSRPFGPPRLRTFGIGALLSLGLAACGGEGASGDCVDNEQFFRDEVWTKVLSQNCIQCHTASGAAKDSDFILVDSNWGPDFLERNYAVVEEIAKREFEGTSWLLLKPTNDDRISDGHGGGERFAVGDEPYQIFEQFIERVRNPVVCEDDGQVDPVDEFFAGVALLDEVATLRKASLSLVGRLPTVEEEQRVRDGGFAEMDVILDEMMATEPFFARLKEIYNDRFLTDRYLPRTDAIDLLDGERYANAYWFDAIADEDESDAAARYANQAVAREALELVAHVVREGRPFTEILTADYMMVNPYSARTYGVFDQIAWTDPSDPDEFREARLPGIPHAGVLTSHIMMNRFPTTPTNRNRHRARKLYEFFLATDVQRLGDRPIDPTNIVDFNPTMNNPNCTLCHGIIDPVAGTFQNWDDLGNYTIPEEGWFTDMLPPGFGDEQLSAAEFPQALQWLSGRVAEDARFRAAVVQTLFKGLSGQDPLREPTDDAAPDYLAKIRAFQAQTETFGAIGEAFVAGNHDIRVVVKEIVKSPWYRAENFEGELDDERGMDLQAVGTGRLLTPEALNRKVEAITGYPYQERADRTQFLTDLNWYRIFYGGIDSDSVVERITEPNGIMANVAFRMANEVACWNTARDFVLPPSDRRLFPFVELAYEPEDANGFEVPAASAAIRANIQYLHQRMLGEFLELNDPEINRSYELFLNVWKDGKAGLAVPEEEGGYSGFLPFNCQARYDFATGLEMADDRIIDEDRNYTVRAWMAVMTYLLSDYRFLHE